METEDNEPKEIPQEETHAVAEEEVVLPEKIFLNELQKLTYHQLVEECTRYRVRTMPDRTRHQIILDLLKMFASQQIPIFVDGILELQPNNSGMLRWPVYNFKPCAEDVQVSSGLVRNYDLRAGHRVYGEIRVGNHGERTLSLHSVLQVEGLPPEEVIDIKHFDKLTAIFPKERIVLDHPKAHSLTARAVDLIAPLGRGTRGLIIAPPRVGKTVLMKEIARTIRLSDPTIRLILLLVDERPEEVTDFKRNIDAEIFSSTFDENPTRHTQIAELVSERAKRLVELKQNVVILIDSITRLARGYNALQPGKGRIMSGGVDAKALLKPKKFFGAARNVEEGGSLTILGTTLVDTGSRMDDVIFEEFKGTGNMEIQLNREMAERRIFPAIHILNSGTRRDDLLYHKEEYERVQMIRKQLASLPAMEAMEVLLKNLRNTDSNAELLMAGLR